RGGPRVSRADPMCRGLPPRRADAGSGEQPQYRRQSVGLHDHRWHLPRVRDRTLGVGTRKGGACVSLNQLTRSAAMADDEIERPDLLFYAARNSEWRYASFPRTLITSVGGWGGRGGGGGGGGGGWRGG